ncbi:MAG: terminase family protein, partial [Nitrososphaerota archaeon]
TQIIFKNGSRILCLPCGRYGSTLRGLTVHFAVVDEAAFIPSEVIESVIFPMLATTKGKIWLLTTPWDKDHITYKAFVSWPKESVYHLPSSVNPLITSAFLEEQKSLIGEERFNQEYLAQFVDDEGSYFPMSLLRSCISDLELEESKGLELYGGYDPGGKDSFAAFVAVQALPKGIFYVYHYLMKKLPSYTHFTVELSEFAKKHRLERLLIDQTGLGGPIVEHAKELGLPAEGIDLTAKVKEELLEHLRILLEQRQIVIPNDPQLIGSLNCIEYQRTRSGGYLFTHRPGTYDDLAYALALACWCAKGPRRGVVAKLEGR